MKGKVTNCTLKTNIAITLFWEQTGGQLVSILFPAAAKIWKIGLSCSPPHPELVPISVLKVTKGTLQHKYVTIQTD